MGLEILGLVENLYKKHLNVRSPHPQGLNREETVPSYPGRRQEIYCLNMLTQRSDWEGTRHSWRLGEA